MRETDIKRQCTLEIYHILALCDVVMMRIVLLQANALRRLMPGLKKYVLQWTGVFALMVKWSTSASAVQLVAFLMTTSIGPRDQASFSFFQIITSDHFSNFSEACQTVGGEKCAFPFTYGGVTFYGCVRSSSAQAWCATKYLYSGQDWGYCSDECPITIY